jgi:hypothetical protein
VLFVVGLGAAASLPSESDGAQLLHVQRAQLQPGQDEGKSAKDQRDQQWLVKIYTLFFFYLSFSVGKFGKARLRKKHSMTSKLVKLLSELNALQSSKGDERSS